MAAGRTTTWDAHAGIPMLAEMLADGSCDDPEETLLVALTRLDLAVVRFALCALAADIDTEQMDAYVLRFFDRVEELIDAQRPAA